jgi:FAD/FMN-containing dehydrogenase
MDVDALRRRLAGTVVEPGEAAFESARAALLWNRLVPERRPRLIVRAACEADVAASVAFARGEGWRVAVRGGGHHWSGVALREDSVLIDLGGLREVSVDADARVVTAQPAVTGRELAARLAAHSLAFPVGHCGSVAMSGYLLSGGMGWNSSAWGPACHSVAAVDVVTADGERLTATDSQHADLLWAARGAGPGFFGVVTRYHLTPRPLPRAIHTSTHVFPFERLEEAVGWATDVRPRLPATVELTLILAAAPPLKAEQCPDGKACIVTATAFADSHDAAVAALAPLDVPPGASESVLSEIARPTPFDALFDNIDNAFVAQHRYLADMIWTNAAPADVLASLRDHMPTAPSARSLVLGGFAADAAPVGSPPSAFAPMGSFVVGCYSIWQEPADDAANRAWQRTALTGLEPFASGYYIGESDIVTTPTRAVRSFTAEAWRRLATLRAQYDPHGVFPGF